MKNDSCFRFYVNSDEAFELLLNGKSLENIFVIPNKEVLEFNKYTKLLSSIDSKGTHNPLRLYDELTNDITEWHKQHQNIWFMPTEYLNINLEDFLLSKISTPQQRERVLLELELFREHNLEVMLCYLIYLIDVFRKNSVVWGVGRGSSCASYILFLIGVHKINSLKYNLDIKEFLK